MIGKLTLQSVLQTIAWTVVCGVAYPVGMTAVCQVLFPRQANGSLVEVDGKVVGSEFMAQQFTGDKYFWPRPSACTYGSSPSGLVTSSGSNLGPTSAQLQTNVTSNAKSLRAAHHLPDSAPIPADLVFASASGLDPDISPEAAQFQVARVAAARGMSVADLQALVDRHTRSAQWGFLGEPRVNVLLLNLELDATHAPKSS
jgi:potassium-transporting ATPase KdpC subunit